MLVASARIRQDDPDTGIAILREAADQAADAHFAVRSEIALCTALGYWAKRDLDTAETYLALVDPRSDIIHARALELQGWCHSGRQNHRQAAHSFQAALLRLDTCKARDVAISAMALCTLAIFAAELFDPTLARFVENRCESMEWSTGTAVHRYLTTMHGALYHEFAGNTVQAYSLAAQAREIAPTIPFQASAWSLSSAIARNAGEFFSSIYFARRAQELLDAIDPRELVGEERFAILDAAECCAHFDPEKAVELSARYWGLAPLDALQSLAGDPRLAADETYISGVIAEAKGECARAQTCYRTSFEMFRDIGYVRRAVKCGHALLKLSADDEVRRYLVEQLAATNNYISASLKGHSEAANPIDPLEQHPIVASLPRAQREVVVLLCQGKTNREIAQLRNLGEQTVKNMLTKHIFRAFGVSSRAALVSTCLRFRAADA
jgi:DNA-binding CsgD family transcriptional regulator